jgi:hypothetical protein
MPVYFFKLYKITFYVALNCLILFCNSYNLLAQAKLGITAGYSNNILISDNSLNERNRDGYIVGINYNYLFNNLFLETNFTFISKNFRFQKFYNSEIYQQYDNNYLQLPVSLGFYFLKAKKIKISISGGGFVSYWLQSHIKGVLPNVYNSIDSLNSNGNITQYARLTEYKVKYIFSDADNRWGFGWNTGIGIHYLINRNICLALKGQYFQSITNNDKSKGNFQLYGYFKTFVIESGVLIELKHAKHILKNGKL